MRILLDEDQSNSKNQNNPIFTESKDGDFEIVRLLKK